MVVEVLRANGHDPCVVLQTGPGHGTGVRHLQAWIRLSTSPLDPAVATAAGRLLALSYGGDLASTDWRHLDGSPGSPLRSPHDANRAGTRPG